MARQKLGIDVEINYPTANQIAKAIKAEWGKVKKTEEGKIKVWIEPDLTSLKSLKTKVQDALNDMDTLVKFKSNIEDPLADLRRLGKEFASLKTDMEKGLKIDLNASSKKDIKDMLSDMVTNGRKAKDTMQDAQQAISKMTTSADAGEFAKISQSLKAMKDNTTQLTEQNKKVENSFKTVTETYVNGELKGIATTQDKISAMKQIIAVQKEINGLALKQTGTTGSENDAYTKRIDTLREQISLLKSDYGKVFDGANADESTLLKNIESIGDMNVALKESAQFQAETNDGYQRAVTLLNEQFSIQKKMQTAGSEEKAILQSRLEASYSEYQSVANRYDLLKNMSSVQRESLQALITEENYQKQLTNAKKEDLETAKRQKDAYNDLKSDLKDIQNIHSKIIDLKAKEDAKVLTGKEEDSLYALRQEYELRKDMYDTSKDLYKAEGLVTDEINDGLTALQNQYSAKNDIQTAQADINAKIATSNSLYDKVYDSLKKIDSLTSKLDSAGDNESSVIQEAINAEKRKQDEIRETIRVQEMVNNAREEEIDEIKRAQTEQSQLNREIAQAQDTDRQTGYSTIGMLDPRSVYDTVRDGAMTIYSNVANLDEQMINIEKVVDASDADLKAFSENIFGYASAVGKSADEYAISVERWATAGFSLSESLALAKDSTMGAFVGNIDESDMVDYMSVPLNAYKDAGIEGADVLNTMNEVANQNAIEMDDLGQAYKRASGTAESAGTTFAQLTGMISGAQEATRLGGEKIGTAFKAMDVNFAKISTQSSKADSDKFSFFRDIGIEVQDANGELRSSYDIIETLAGKWGTLSKEQQNMALFYAGGKNHAAVLQGLVSNWDNVTKATAEAEGQLSLVDKTSGSAYQEFGKQQDSIAFAVAQLKNAWTELMQNVSGGREGIKGVVDQMTSLLNVAVKFSENEQFMSVLKTLLSATLWLTANTAMQKVFNTIGAGTLMSIRNLKTSASDMKGLFGAMGNGAKVVEEVGENAVKTGNKFGKLANFVKIGSKGFGMIIPVIGTAIGVFTLLDTAVELLTGKDLGGWLMKEVTNFDGINKAVKKYTESTEKYAKQLDKTDLISGDLEKSEKLISKFEALIQSKKDYAQQQTDETGTEVKPNMTEDEFLSAKKEIETWAEENGIELDIAINDFDYFMAQVAKAREEVNSIFQKGAQDYADKTEKRNETKEYGKNGYEGLREEEKGNWSKFGSQFQGNIDLANSDWQAYLEQYVFNTEEFEALQKERNEKIKAQDEQFGKLMGSLQYLDITKLDQSGAFTMAGELGSGGREIKSKMEAYAQLNAIMAEGRDLTTDEYLAIAKQIPEIEAWGNQLSTWDDAKREAIANQSRQSAEETDLYLFKMRQSLEASGQFSAEQITTMMAQLQGTNTEYIRMMGQLGESGQLAIGITDKTLASYEGNVEAIIEDMAIMQEQLDGMNGDVVTKYHFETDEGLVNMEIVDAVRELPESITTTYGLVKEDGSIDFQNLSAFFDTVPPKVQTEYKLLGADGNLDVMKTMEFVSTIGGLPKEIITKYSLIKEDGSIDYDKLTEFLGNVPDDIQTKYELVDKEGNVDVVKTMEYIQSLSPEKIVEVFGNTTDVNAKLNETSAKTDEVEAKDPTVSVYGDATDFNSTYLDVDTKAQNREVTISFWSWIDDALKGVMAWVNDGNKSVNVNTTSSGSGGKSGGGVLPSVAITNPNIGRSLSQSISGAVGIPQASTSFSETTDYQNSSTPATVSSDVWRYWGKEMYNGMPLERSMEDLTDAIDKAGDDNEKLISLYKQQISLLDSQVAYQQDMQNSKQDELNGVLADLRNQGFTTSGNKVTNLGIASGMSGDQATTVNDLLGKWKTLYESIDSLTGTINDLNMEKFNLDKDVADAKVALELSKIEATLKKTEALLTSIENDTDLFGQKLDFVNDADYELKLSISEEGLNKSIGNVKTLSDEFNRLSAMYVENSDNASEVLSQLDSLKDGILSNADAVIEYRNAMKDLEIDRFTSDFDEFSTALESNLSNLNNNIETLREGLLSGQTLGGLQSSGMMGLEFGRKSEIEKQYQERLDLETKLNSALEGYAQKNVDRVTQVANETLTVESQKYAGLLKLASDYSDGKASSVSLGSSSAGVGAVSATSNDGKHQEWLSRLVEINNSYTSAYASMVAKYDSAMANAKTNAEKEILTNAIIIEQLRLQEGIYDSMIKANSEAIAQVNEKLLDTTLTTEQRQTLLDSVEEYKQANIDAQNSIRESVSSRYDLEFELIDESIAKAQSYSDEIGNLLSIAEAVGSSDAVMSDIYNAVYEGKINEFTQAQAVLSKLAEEQSKFLEGSYEWNLLKGKIDDVESSLSGLTLDILDANENVLGNKLDSIQKASEKLMLGGKTLDEWSSYRDSFIDGIEKELELEKLRGKLANVEDKTLKSKLELMDRQEKVSKAELDYVDKQLDVIALQEKLNNIGTQRNVQTLGKDANGNWEWQYVADQTEYDKTKSELQDAQLELEQYKQEQVEAYVGEMNDIIEAVRNGDYSSESQLQNAIGNANEMFDDILGESANYDTNAIMQAYRDYVASNSNIVGGLTGNTDTMAGIGMQFEKSFLAISTDLGRIIGEELRKAINTQPISTAGQTVVIENQVLEFPNVTDSSGIEDVFRELPQIAKQMSTTK